MKNMPPVPIKKATRFRCRFRVRICLIALAGFAALAQESPQKVASTSEVQGGLRISLIQEASPAHFRAELRNAGVQALTLNLGTMLDNGREQYVDRIHLLLTSDKGEQLHLQMAGPAMIMGRVDPLVVPLPPGATFTLPIDLRNYIALQEKAWNLSLDPGHYTLTAEYEGVGVSQASANLDMKGIALMPYWIGDVTSPKLAFTLTQKMEGRARQ
jgi:hypothetical protein